MSNSKVCLGKEQCTSTSSPFPDINYDKLGYQKDSNLIYFHDSCFFNYPNSNPPVKNVLIKLTSQRLENYLDSCLTPNDHSHISNQLRTNITKPFLVYCGKIKEKPKDALYINPLTIKIDNQYINEVKVFNAVLAKYNPTAKSRALKSNLSDACRDCCYNALQDGKKCRECFSITPTQNPPHPSPIKPSFENLQKTLFALIENKNQCDQNCQISLYELLKVFPEAQTLYAQTTNLKLNTPTTMNKTTIINRDLTKDEESFLKEKYRGELAGIRARMYFNRNVTEEQIQQELKKFMLTQIQKDPFIILKEKHNDELAALHANMTLLDGKTIKEADEAVENFLQDKLKQQEKEKLSSNPLPTNLPIDRKLEPIPDPSYTHAFVTHILAASGKNWEEMQTLLDSEEISNSTCTNDPKQINPRPGHALVVSLRKKMARKVYDGLVKENDKKVNPPDWDNTPFVVTLTKYVRIMRNGCQ